MHGRHFTRNVEGLPRYNPIKYEICPLHNPISFRIVEIRDNELVNEEIRELIEGNRAKISSDIRKIIGILLRNEKVNFLIADYIVARDYCYSHTNKFNIPYSILYTREAISLFGQKIDKSELGNRIQNAINERCMYFEVQENRIKAKVSEYVELDLLVSNHRINGSKQYITIKLEEKFRNEVNIIFEEEIEMKQYLYSL